jgi:hypothetical protein
LRLAWLPSPRAWLLGLAACFAAVSCFDPPLLPAPSFEPDGGSGSNGLAGEPADSGGQHQTAAGAPHGGAPDEPAGGEYTGGGGHDIGGTAGSGGTDGGGGAGGSGPARITWLELVGSEAPASATVNAELGIAGTFYAYADACASASISWNPTTRCASGTLCNAGPQWENWGVAVGFDFNNTGDSGEPPNTKRLWDPGDVSAQGLAWRVSGLAPGLQVWVLNMDPSFGGACSEETCEIPGPPDGVSAAALHGELLFTNMEKDHWGSPGTNYMFDPALVHALQLKLPAINVGAASFSFCIDALGVIR